MGGVPIGLCWGSEEWRTVDRGVPTGGGGVFHVKHWVDRGDYKSVYQCDLERGDLVPKTRGPLLDSGLGWWAVRVPC